MRDNLAEQSDNELIERYRAGEEECFPVLFERYEAEVFMFLLKSVHNNEVADDIFQDAFLTVIKSLKQYQSGSNFKAWLYKIVRSRMIDFFRKEKNRKHAPLFEMDTEIGEGTRGPATRVMEKDMFSFVDKAMEVLNEHENEVIRMRTYANLTFEEIAEVLQCPLGTVLARMRRGMTKLKERVENGL